MGNHDQRCRATRRDGAPCGMHPLDGGAYCFAHDPSKRSERHAAATRGGRNRAAVVRLQRLMPPRLVTVYTTLETALQDVLAGALPPNQAMAAAALARAMVAVLQAGELEERLRAVEGRAVR